MFIFGVLVMAGLVFFLRQANRDSIRKYIESHGGELISREYDRSGKNWFGGNRDPVYRISYRDKQGNLHESFAKANAFSGVYLSEDTIVEYSGKKDQKARELEQENERLKEELARLKKKSALEEEFKHPPVLEKKEKQKQEPDDAHSGDTLDHPTRISAFDTEEGELIIEQRSPDLAVSDKVFLNNQMAPDGRYKLGFLNYIYVKDGRIS